MKITIYNAGEKEDGIQYVAIDEDWKLLECHFSSSEMWAKNSDIVPTVREKYNQEPEWEADSLNVKALMLYEELSKKYEKWCCDTEEAKHFIQWLEEVNYI